MTARDKQVLDHLAKHDKQIRAILALVKQGMRMVIEDKQAIRELRATLKAFIERTGSGNGHDKRKVDLQ